jgi:hypothetical protein
MMFELRYSCLPKHFATCARLQPFFGFSLFFRWGLMLFSLVSFTWQSYAWLPCHCNYRYATPQQACLLRWDLCNFLPGLGCSQTTNFLISISWAAGMTYMSHHVQTSWVFKSQKYFMVDNLVRFSGTGLDINMSSFHRGNNWSLKMLVFLLMEAEVARNQTRKILQE